MRIENGIIIATTQDVIQFLNRSEETIVKYSNKGMYEYAGIGTEQYVGKPTKLYDLKKCVEWLLDNIDLSKSKEMKGSKNLKALQEEKLKIGIDIDKARLIRAKFDIEAQRGKYFLKDEVYGEWIPRFVTVVAMIYQLCSRLPNRCVGKSEIDIMEIVTQESINIVTELKTKGKFNLLHDMTEKEKEILIDMVEGIKGVING